MTYEHRLSDIFRRMDDIYLVDEEKKIYAQEAIKPEYELTPEERLDIVEKKLDELIIIIGQRRSE